ncbi:hypothetical protein [Dongia sp. agr-C8]
MDKPVPEFVIRLASVSIGRPELESALGFGLDRFEPTREEPGHYAQVSMSETADQWSEVVTFLEQVGPKIASLISLNLIGSASMDFEVFIPIEDAANFMVHVPAEVASLAGQNRLAVELSIYPLFRRRG